MSENKSRSEKARERGPATLDRLQKKKPRTETVAVYLDDELAADVERLYKAVKDAETRVTAVKSRKFKDAGAVSEAQSELSNVQSQYKSAVEALEDETVHLKFRALSNTAYENLLNECPPKKEDIEAAKKEGRGLPQFDAELFVPAVIGESCYEPDLSEGKYYDDDEERNRYPAVEALNENLNQAEVSELFMAAFRVNTEKRTLKAGNG